MDFAEQIGRLWIAVSCVVGVQVGMITILVFMARIINVQAKRIDILVDAALKLCDYLKEENKNDRN